MSFKKGREKTGGRKKGVINRSTNEMRLLLTQALSGHIERIPEYIEELTEVKEKLRAISYFMPYIQPKLQSIQYMEVPAIVELLEMNADERQARIAEIKEQIKAA